MTQHQTKKATSIGSIVIIILLVINIVLSSANLLKKDAVWEAEAMKVGGQENFEILTKLYGSEEFQNQQKEGLLQALASFGGEKNEITQTTDNQKEENKDIVEAMKYIQKDGHINGNKKARFTILEYSEIVCPFCKRQKDNETIEKILEKYPNEVNSMFRNFIVHPQATKFAEAFECAGELGGEETYYTFIKKAFKLNNVTMESLGDVVAEVGLNQEKLTACIESGKYTEKVTEQTTEGRNLFNVTGTPGNVIVDNETGRFTLIAGAHPFEKFEAELQKLMDN